MQKPILTASLALSCLTIVGCTSSAGPRTPDEFNVVTKAPLTVPPDYKLRPPAVGTSTPSEVDPSRAQSPDAFGTSVGTNASASEKALVAAAGANAVSPIIRAQVDYEEAGVVRKSTSVSDRILFWRKGAEAEGEKDTATGGGDVQIERTTAQPRIKLPGT